MDNANLAAIKRTLGVYGSHDIAKIYLEELIYRYQQEGKTEAEVEAIGNAYWEEIANNSRIQEYEDPTVEDYEEYEA